MAVFGLTLEAMEELERYADGCMTRADVGELDEVVPETEKTTVFVSMAISLKRIAIALERIEEAMPG